MFAQRIKIPVCTDLNKNLFKTVEILFDNFVVHVLWNKLKTQWNLHFPPNNRACRTATLIANVTSFAFLYLNTVTKMFPGHQIK